METLPNLICGKFTVGGKDNLPPDIQALIMQNARIAMDQEKYQKEFDEQLWVSMVYHVVVHSKEDIRVVYRDGIEK